MHLKKAEETDGISKEIQTYDWFEITIEIPNAFPKGVCEKINGRIINEFLKKSKAIVVLIL